MFQAGKAVPAPSVQGAELYRDWMEKQHCTDVAIPCINMITTS